MPLRAKRDGTWRASVRPGAAFTVWVIDPEGVRAGVATAVKPGSAETPVVALAPAGRLVLPPWEEGMPERWVELRDAAHALLYSGWEFRLPVVPNLGHCLVLPPGAYRVELSQGLARRGPKVFRVTAVAGATSRMD